MSYHGFAYHYDVMMADVDYSLWTSAVCAHVAKGGRVLDVGCGTGTLALALIESGYAVTGLEISEDMLVVASEKAKAQHIDIDFIQQDMRQLEGLSDFDGVLIAVDSLNYLDDETDVKQTFAGVHGVLADAGILIFDVHTPLKMTHIFNDYLYVDNDEALTYIWHVEAGDKPLSIVHELTIFAKNENGTYTRTMEHHHQRTFEMATYRAWLVEAGFEIISQTGDESRQLFIAKKI